MKKAIRLFALLLIIVVPASAQVGGAYQARLQFVLDSVCSKYKIKGASAAVHVPGVGTWKGASGISHTGQPITDDMLFAYNSNTKTYIAALMLKLQEDGLLSLNDTIGKWIVNKANINGQITVRQLLNHTSGLFSYTNHAAFFDSVQEDFTRIWQPAEMLAFVDAPVAAPGATWDYSNTNYLLAGMVIAQITGMPVQQALRNKILTPSSLQRTWYYPAESYTGTVPHVWIFDGVSQTDGTSFNYDHRAFYSMAGSAGALFGTAEDNALFWSKLISGQIINAASMAQWRQTVYLSFNESYGLGMFRLRSFNGHVCYSHGGTGLGFINENIADSVTGVTISVLTNQDSIDNNLLLTRLVSALHKVSLNPPTAVHAPGNDLVVKVFPNPASQFLAIETKENDITAWLVNTVGQQVSQAVSFDQKTTMSIASLPAGNYYLMLQQKGGAVKVVSVGKL